MLGLTLQEKWGALLKDLQCSCLQKQEMRSQAVDLERQGPPTSGSTSGRRSELPRRTPRAIRRGFGAPGPAARSRRRCGTRSPSHRPENRWLGTDLSARLGVWPREQHPGLDCQGNSRGSQRFFDSGGLFLGLGPSGS